MLKINTRPFVFRACFTVLACALIAGLALALPKAFADSATPAGPHVVVTIAGAVKHGEAYVALDKGVDVKPGDIVRWTLQAKNDGSAPAQNVSVSGKVHASTSYVLETAQGNANPVATFSIDSGKEFSTQPTIQHKLADGTSTTVPAPITDYTNVRFTWTSAIAPGEMRSATYDVRVK